MERENCITCLIIGMIGILISISTGSGILFALCVIYTAIVFVICVNTKQF